MELEYRSREEKSEDLIPRSLGNLSTYSLEMLQPKPAKICKPVPRAEAK